MSNDRNAEEIGKIMDKIADNFLDDKKENGEHFYEYVKRELPKHVMPKCGDKEEEK